MLKPTKEEFIELAKKGNIIPIYKEIIADLETPVSTFLKTEKGRYSYLLESVEGGEKIARYSFLGSDPYLVIKSRGKSIEITKGNTKKRFQTKEDPLREIEKLMQAYRYVNVEGLPRFCGGLVGYIGYDMVRFFEDIPDETHIESENFGKNSHVKCLVSSLEVKHCCKGKNDRVVTEITQV